MSAAAAKVLSSEIEKRAERLTAAPNSDFVLADDGNLRWLGETVAKLSAGETACGTGHQPDRADGGAAFDGRVQDVSRPQAGRAPDLPVG